MGATSSSISAKRRRRPPPRTCTSTPAGEPVGRKPARLESGRGAWHGYGARHRAEQYGTLPRATVMAPAIRLARDGFVLTGGDAALMTRGAPLLRHDEAAARQFPACGRHTLPRRRDRLRQPELAVTLQSIADRGPDAFYMGHIPDAVEAASGRVAALSRQPTSPLTTPRETEPLGCGYRGNVDAVSAAAVLRRHGFVRNPQHPGGLRPSRHGLSCRRLGACDGGGDAATPFSTATPARRSRLCRKPAGPPVVQGLRRAVARTDHRPRDPVSGSRASTAAAVREPQTTHYSVVDHDRNAVSVTYTINGGFGAGVVAGDTGFLLNNEMDDFTIALGEPNRFGLVQGEANLIAPGNDRCRRWRRPSCSRTARSGWFSGRQAARGSSRSWWRRSEHDRS